MSRVKLPVSLRDLIISASEKCDSVWRTHNRKVHNIMKQVLVTGGNTGIGFALCKLLVNDHDCYVYLGSRSVDKGVQALKSIQEQVSKEKAMNIEVVQLDVCSEESIQGVVNHLTAKGIGKNIFLYALVNNAGVNWKTGQDNPETMMATNFYGPKRVIDALKGMLNPREGRIINVSSGAASMWLRDQDDATKELFTNPHTTWEDLNGAVKANVAAKNFKKGHLGHSFMGYGLSKAALTALTVMYAQLLPGLTITSLSPGFVDTNMTAGYGAKLSPEEGCKSTLKCLFGDVKSGCYYGSDGLRSPLTISRDPGAPEYQGEDNPDPAKYNV